MNDPKTEKAQLITPRTLKGFRDFTPEMMLPREELIDTVRRVYRSYGFCPIDTPALEYLEILTGKGSDETDRQMYRFEDHGGRQVGMRFDLTVPLARFAAQHHGKLGLPFKRYHIASVWRGESTQRGCFREFMQCDFDTIGTLSNTADIETVLVVHDMMQALGFDRFTIRLNNRMVLNGLLDKLALRDRATEILRSLDKLDKIGPDKVAVEMCAVAEMTPAAADEVLELVNVSGSNEQILSQLEKVVGDQPLGAEGVERLAGVIEGARAGGVADERIRIDVAIARGLDYYTGTILETVLDDLPGIGSVCSGGRYDNLAQTFTKTQLPGIGASLGLDRLLAAMEELKLIERTVTPAEIFIAYFDKNRLADYISLAADLRKAGYGVALFPEPKKLGQQLKYADSQGFRVAIVAGANELENKLCQVKNMTSGEQVETSIDVDDGALVKVLQGILDR